MLHVPVTETVNTSENSMEHGSFLVDTLLARSTLPTRPSSPKFKLFVYAQLGQFKMWLPLRPN